MGSATTKNFRPKLCFKNIKIIINIKTVNVQNQNHKYNIPVKVWKQWSLNVSASSTSIPEDFNSGLKWLAIANNG